MDIIARNFFCLLRAGAFRRPDAVEPMSQWKWRQVCSLSMLHGVEAATLEGARLLDSQYFMRLSPGLRQQWEQAAAQRSADAGASTRQLAGRRMMRRLDRLGAELGSASPTFRLLRQSADVAQCLITADRWVAQLVRLGQLVRQEGSRADREQLASCSRQLQLGRMQSLQSVLLVRLLGFAPDEVPFALPSDERRWTAMADEVVHTISDTRHHFQFQQGTGIFVHTSSASAMLWQARHSARYLRYYPTQSVNTLFSSFVQSLTNIEE